LRWHEAGRASTTSLRFLGYFKNISMNSEPIFRLVFALLYVLLILIRAYFDRKAQPVNPTVSEQERWTVLVNREGRIRITLRAMLFLIMAAAVILYIIYPSGMARFTLPLPDWLRWLGVGLGIICIPLLIWIYVALGQYWSPGLELKEQHRLVASGPYRRVRHPMYAIFLTFMVSASLISANGWVAVPSVLMMFLINERIGSEERMMIAYFGDAYQAYMKTTGRLLPRLY
jgi:protein-S-isoprenylcysteine O-methyltransferase Ste14